jgi:predicted SnoaL-like aldol condensation-catalyzing enzyme
MLRRDAALGAEECGTPAVDQNENNKELVRQFYDAFYTARRTGDTSLIDKFVAPDYIQHEFGVESGREGLKALLIKAHAASASVEPPVLLHVIADGDMVAAHQVVPGPDPNGSPAAEGVDIFRISGGQLVEHWGVDVENPDATAQSGTPTS